MQNELFRPSSEPNRLTSWQPDGWQVAAGWGDVVAEFLSNETGHEIMYLTGLNSIAPLGYRYSRKVGEPQWTFLPKTKDRSERLFRLSGISGNYVYLRLPANSGVEFEIPDWASSREKLEEHAFSVFIKFDDNENTIVSVELTSEIFYPLVRETAVFETISPTRSYSWASVILTL